MEWYIRERDIDETSRHVSVSGSQISPAKTAPPRSSFVAVPPTAMIEPSSRIGVFIRRRGWCIGAVSRHCGLAEFMSITAVWASAGSPPPARRIRPGPYMAPDSE